MRILEWYLRKKDHRVCQNTTLNDLLLTLISSYSTFPNFLAFKWKHDDLWLSSKAINHPKLYGPRSFHDAHTWETDSFSSIIWLAYIYVKYVKLLLAFGCHVATYFTGWQSKPVSDIRLSLPGLLIQTILKVEKWLWLHPCFCVVIFPISRLETL